MKAENSETLLISGNLCQNIKGLNWFIAKQGSQERLLEWNAQEVMILMRNKFL